MYRLHSLWGKTETFEHCVWLTWAGNFKIDLNGKNIKNSNVNVLFLVIEKIIGYIMHLF